MQISEPTPLLVASSLSKHWGATRAVADVSLRVDAGESLAIIGPNGAGKSTLFGIIAGEYRPSSGSLRFRGRDITPWPAHRRARFGISRTFQVARLFSSRTIEEHLYLAASIKDGHHRRTLNNFATSDKDYSGIVEAVIAELRLAGIRGHRASVLPQGDRKRLELAMAVVQGPDLLLLDEPTAGMSNEDCAITVRLIDEIRQRAPKLSIIITGHDMSVIFSVATRVVLMSEGRAVLDGTPAEVRGNELTNLVYLGTSHD